MSFQKFKFDSKNTHKQRQIFHNEEAKMFTVHILAAQQLPQVQYPAKDIPEIIKNQKTPCKR